MKTNNFKRITCSLLMDLLVYLKLNKETKNIIYKYSNKSWSPLSFSLSLFSLFLLTFYHMHEILTTNFFLHFYFIFLQSFPTHAYKDQPFLHQSQRRKPARTPLLFHERGSSSPPPSSTLATTHPIVVTIRLSPLYSLLPPTRTELRLFKPSAPLFTCIGRSNRSKRKKKYHKQATIKSSRRSPFLHYQHH